MRDRTSDLSSLGAAYIVCACALEGSVRVSDPKHMPKPTEPLDHHMFRVYYDDCVRDTHYLFLLDECGIHM